MWPWEHLAVGYLLWSLYAHVFLGHSPDGRTVLVLAVATQLPDLIDKPLAWVFGVLPSGTSLGHSIFFALAVCALALLLASRWGATELGTAFSIGYLAHLPADVVYPAIIGGNVAVGKVLWPVVPTPDRTVGPLVPLLSDLFDTFAAFLLSPAGFWYVLLEVSLVGGALLLWAWDGRPGIRTAWRFVVPGV